MSWWAAAGLILVGAAGTVGTVGSVAYLICLKVAESEARMSPESAEHLRGSPHMGSRS